jgi:anti-sigma regulatory factor (Ser/Thr protein kinase)
LHKARALGTMTRTMPPMSNPEEILPAATSTLGEPRGVARAGYPAPSQQSRRLLRLALPADPISISVARARVRRWLAGWSWPADQLDDIVLAVSEAVSNAIEHAYLGQPPGTVDVRGGIEATPRGQRQATIIVRDHGRWRPTPIHHENRRRGIPLMRACMDTVTIGQFDDDPVGTRVVLRSKAVPPPKKYC